MSDTQSHILVVDDHREIRDALARLLRESGYRVSAAESAASARTVLRAGAPDLVLLDIMMPGEDGLSLCRSVVETMGLPVILLTARIEDTDKIVGLEMGADDYVTKPFNPRELLARVKAVLRRTQALPPRQRPPEHDCYRFDGWTLDVGTRTLTREDGVHVPLSSGEFRLLMAFLERPGLVLSREQLLDITRGRDAQAFDRSIDNQVSRLRRKIEPDPAHPTLVKTVWGGGYSFSAKVDPP